MLDNQSPEKRQLEKYVQSLSHENYKQFFELFSQLAEIAFSDTDFVMCPCCRAAWIRQEITEFWYGEYKKRMAWVCKCVTWTEEYKIRCGELKYCQPGHHDRDQDFMETFMANPDRCCSGACTIEGIMGDNCRRCGTYCGIDELICNGCFEKIVEHFSSNPFQKLLTSG